MYLARPLFLYFFISLVRTFFIVIYIVLSLFSSLVRSLFL